jgi:sterol desaturase/sphingolipid hydroxylase (fatty acid hydroxylase superfamily)
MSLIIEYAELAGLLCIPAFLLLDFVVRRRAYKKTRLWRLRAFTWTVLTYFLSMGITLGWAALLGGASLLDGSGLGIVGGALVGILVYELVHYWYHRVAHSWSWLWRAAHQMHHSAESHDAFGAYWLHPLDTFFFTTWSSLVFFPLLGLEPAAGALAGTFLVFNAMFQHANLKTPLWVGYLIQRPESHSTHHRRHRHNYADLPLWDMIFGTFKNTPEMEPRTGFYHGASTRVLDMLVGRDVNKMRRPAPARAAVAPARSVARRAS